MRTPQNVSSTSLAALRTDYATDYVLMVAETYEERNDLALASFHLAYLGGDDPLYHVQRAIIAGEALNYPLRDIESLAELAAAFQSLDNTQGAP